MQRKLLAIFFVAALAVAAKPALADADTVQFFHDIDVTSDTPVHDAVCFFCNISIEGNAEGDIVDFFGNVRLDGEAHHDVVNFFGHVTAADNSSVGGDLVSLFGSIRLGQNVTVGKDVVAVFGVVHTPGSVTVGGDRVSLSPLILFVPLLIVFLVIFLIVSAVRAHRMRQFAHGYPPPPYR